MLTDEVAMRQADRSDRRAAIERADRRLQETEPLRQAAIGLTKELTGGGVRR